MENSLVTKATVQSTVRLCPRHSESLANLRKGLVELRQFLLVLRLPRQHGVQVDIDGDLRAEAAVHLRWRQGNRNEKLVKMVFSTEKTDPPLPAGPS
mgnify:CR=1 FL=1